MGQGGEPPDIIIPRDSLCLSRPSPGVVLHSGQDGFTEELRRLYAVAESNAAEQLIRLKDRLRKLDTESFWALLTEGLANITRAQYAFVSKRIVLDDENIAVEMPPIGESGSCLMGAALYTDDGHGEVTRLRNFKYHAYSCPCAYMRHDKVFVIPEGLNDFIINNPNKLNLPGEAYIGVPLFAEGKCFAHFGVMWSPEGATKRDLSWAYIEMLCHSLEDMILERVLEGRNFAKSVAPNPRLPSRVIPHEAVSVTQSLKPYARSLSHELRTPMQGVVGMLDVMYATVQEASEGQRDPEVLKVFETLKENIEVVQDSSRRAVEAADNVVHAYDMNMGVPDAAQDSVDEESGEFSQHSTKPKPRSPEIVVTGNNIPINHLRGSKRRRNSTSSIGMPSKHHAPDGTWAAQAKAKEQGRKAIDTSTITHPPSINQPALNTGYFTADAAASAGPGDAPSSPTFASETHVVPGLRHTNLRDVLQYIVNDSLKVGGRPESAIAQETDGGEVIEVRTRSGSGVENIKIIEWSVDSSVPESILSESARILRSQKC